MGKSAVRFACVFWRGQRFRAGVHHARGVGHPTPPTHPTHPAHPIYNSSHYNPTDRPHTPQAMPPRAKPNASTGSSSSSFLLFVLYPILLLLPLIAVGTVPLKRLPATATLPPAPSLDQVSEYTLRTAAFPSLFSLFLSLPPPSAPLHGEYLAEILDAGSFPANVLGWAGFNPFFPGVWVGKAFVEGEDGGWGYNVLRFALGAFVHRRFRMATSIQPSTWDGKPSFELQYGAQPHILGSFNMRDEVREVHPGLYLGMGTFGYTEAKRREDPLPFLLRGPFHPPVPGEVKEGYVELGGGVGKKEA